MIENTLQVGDELIVKIKITKDAEKAHQDLLNNLYRQEEICDGIMLTSIYFKGASIETIKKEITKDILSDIDRALNS